MVILIPFLTQPPYERTLTGRGSRVYPNVGAAGCTLTSGQPGAAWSGQEVCSGFAPRGSLYEFVLYNLYKKMYELVQKRHRVQISTIQFRTKISEKKICIRVGISTRDQNGLQSSQRYTIHHPTASISGHFIYIPYNKNTIRKSGLNDFIRMAYSQPQLTA
jgi:hypothetical protein